MLKSLNDVFESAIARVEGGKGKERHGSDDQPFTAQPMFSIPKELRSDSSPMLFQAVKKIYESRRFANPDAKRNELLDAIVYIASALIYDDMS